MWCNVALMRKFCYVEIFLWGIDIMWKCWYMFVLSYVVLSDIESSDIKTLHHH